MSHQTSISIAIYSTILNERGLDLYLKTWLCYFDKLTKLSKVEQHNKKVCHYLEQVELCSPPNLELARGEEYFWSFGICMRLYEE